MRMVPTSVCTRKWVWLNIEQEGQTAGFGPCFHLPGFHFGTGFLSHSQIKPWLKPSFKGACSAKCQFRPSAKEENTLRTVGRAPYQLGQTSQADAFPPASPPQFPPSGARRLRTATVKVFLAISFSCCLPGAQNPFPGFFVPPSPEPDLWGSPKEKEV